MTREQEVQKYMDKLSITKEEAEQLWQDDHDDVVTPEMAEMEKKAKQIKRYEKSDAPRKKTSRERKPDPDKRKIISTVAENLELCVFDRVDDYDLCVDIKILKPEREITFRVGSDEYSLVLTKHRPKK